jgi:hypothetical protein
LVAIASEENAIRFANTCIVINAQQFGSGHWGRTCPF